jgi:hypothetical protein
MRQEGMVGILEELQGGYLAMSKPKEWDKRATGEGWVL